MILSLMYIREYYIPGLELGPGPFKPVIWVSEAMEIWKQDIEL